MHLELEDLDGNYDIRYNSTPPLPNWYEIGKGEAIIKKGRLIGKDAAGVAWDAQLTKQATGEITFTAMLDPTGTPPNVGLMGSDGVMTKNPQQYSGKIGVTMASGKTVLRTRVVQGKITINVQFIRVS